MQEFNFGYNEDYPRRSFMIRLRVLEILNEQQHSKYWLYKQMEMSYQNFNRMVNNETSSIRFELLDKMSNILNVPVGDLFEQNKE